MIFITKEVPEGFIVPMYTDIGFKGAIKSNKEFFTKFASKLLNIPYDAIADGEFVDNEPIPDKSDNKHYRVDIIFQSNDIIINAEANAYTKGISFRNNMYIFRIFLNGKYSKQMSEGKIKDAYQININKAHFDYNTKLINRFEMREDTNEIRLPYTPIIVNVALEFLDDEEYTKGIDSWLLNAIRLFNATNENEYEQIVGTDKTMKEVMRFMVNYSKKSDVLDMYWKEKDEEIARNIDMADARNEGLQEGHQKGLQEGFKEGKIETAKNLLKEKIDVDLIARATGLSKEEIEGLK